MASLFSFIPFQTNYFLPPFISATILNNLILKHKFLFCNLRGAIGQCRFKKGKVPLSFWGSRVLHRGTGYLFLQQNENLTKSGYLIWENISGNSVPFSGIHPPSTNRVTKVSLRVSRYRNPKVCIGPRNTFFKGVRNFFSALDLHQWV